MGIDKGVQRLVAFAVALGLPGVDGPALLKTGDVAFGGQLTEVVYVEARREVDGAGARFGQFQASVDGILQGIDADSEQRDLAFVGAGWASWPDRDAGAASALDRQMRRARRVRQNS